MKSIKNRDDLGSLLRGLGLNGFGCEIGVQRGHNAKQILSQWNGQKFYLVDLWVGRSARFYPNIISHFSKISNVKIIKSSSIEASKMFTDSYFDWVYIDAAHDFNNVLADLVSWYPKVRSGGLIAGHDYTSRRSHWGVRPALEAFLKVLSKQPEIYLTQDFAKTFYFIKN